MSWLGRSKAPPRRETARDQAAPPQPPQIPDVPSPSVVSTAPKTDLVLSEYAPSAPAMQSVPEPALDIAAIEQRYPLLRNAL